MLVVVASWLLLHAANVLGTSSANCFPFSHRTSRMRWFGHVERSTGWIAKVRKLNVVAQKRPGRPKKTWDEVQVDDRKKLGMDSADPMNRSGWRGRLRGRLVKQAQPSVEENRL